MTKVLVSDLVRPLDRVPRVELVRPERRYIRLYAPRPQRNNVERRIKHKELPRRRPLPVVLWREARDARREGQEDHAGLVDPGEDHDGFVAAPEAERKGAEAREERREGSSSTGGKLGPNTPVWYKKLVSSGLKMQLQQDTSVYKHILHKQCPSSSATAHHLLSARYAPISGVR